MKAGSRNICLSVLYNLWGLKSDLQSVPETDMKEAVMRKPFGLAAASLAIWGLASAYSPGERSFQITALIYQTPPLITTVVSAGPDGKGGFIGGQIGGMVTSQFPNATVFLKLGEPADFTDETIRAKINKNFVFKCGDALSQGLPADLIGKMVYIIQDGKLTKSAPGIISTNNPESPPSGSPGLNLDLISEQNDRWILALKFELAENLLNTPGKSSVLLDQIIGMRAAEPILIGFPFVVFQKGKFIYWMALHIEMTGR
jgi:hypothetical protein